MKITKYGTVILQHNAPVRVEGWEVEREPDDPVDATPEQMLLEVTIPWAQQRLNDAIMANLRELAKLRKAAEALNPTVKQAL